MSHETTLLLLGILVVLVPFLGLPYAWLMVVMPMLGITVSALAVILRARAMQRAPHLAPASPSPSFDENISAAL